MKTLLMTLAALAAASSPAAGGPLETVEAYLEAHNRHDVEAALDLLSPEIVYVMPDGEKRTGLEPMAELEAWDAVLESFLDVSELEVVGSSVVAGEMVEDNLWYRLSGIGPVTYLPGAIFEVENGRITSIHAASWKPEHVVAFTNFIDEFAPWASVTFPRELSTVMPGGTFHYDGDTAKIWLELLVVWNEETQSPAED